MKKHELVECFLLITMMLSFITSLLMLRLSETHDNVLELQILSIVFMLITLIIGHALYLWNKINEFNNFK